MVGDLGLAEVAEAPREGERLPVGHERAHRQRRVGLVGERHVAHDRAARVADDDDRAAAGVDAVPDRLGDPGPDVRRLHPVGHQDPHVAEPVDQEGVDRPHRGEVLERLPRDRPQDPEQDEGQDDEDRHREQEQGQEDDVHQAEEPALGPEARHDAPEQALELPRHEPVGTSARPTAGSPGPPTRPPSCATSGPGDRRSRAPGRRRTAGTRPRSRCWPWRSGRCPGTPSVVARHADQAEERAGPLQQPLARRLAAEAVDEHDADPLRVQGRRRRRRGRAGRSRRRLPGRRVRLLRPELGRHPGLGGGLVAFTEADHARSPPRRRAMVLPPGGPVKADGRYQLPMSAGIGLISWK